MANNAADSFARDRESVGIRDENLLFDRHAGFVMAADAEVAIRAIREPVHPLGHGVEDGAELRIGMLGNGPLTILPGVALGALRRGRKFVGDEQIVVRDHRLGLDVAQRTTVHPEVGLVFLVKDGVLGFCRVGPEVGLALVDLFLHPVAGGVEIGAGRAQHAGRLLLGGRLALFDFEQRAALEIADFVDPIGSNPGGNSDELEELVLDSHLPVPIERIQIPHEPKSLIRHAFSARGGIAKDVVFNSGGPGLDVLLNNGFPLSVEVGGLLLKRGGLSLDDRGFLFKESLAFLLRLDGVPVKGSLH